MGAPLQEGGKYTLVIDHNWLDADSKPLKQDYRKSFQAGPADRKPLDQSKWRVVSPKSGTVDPVSVEFPEPMDHALLQRQLDVLDASRNVVEGSIQIDRDETRWLFIPKSAWRLGSYSIQVGTVITDLAGNMVDHPFDVDVFEKVDETIVREVRDLRFTVK